MTISQKVNQLPPMLIIHDIDYQPMLKVCIQLLMVQCGPVSQSLTHDTDKWIQYGEWDDIRDRVDRIIKKRCNCKKD